jgi:quercetin dioxygenase-like cupin family protein
MQNGMLLGRRYAANSSFIISHSPLHGGGAMPLKAARSKTKTPGAIKGGEGKYQYALSKVRKVPAGTGYSTSHGGVVEGDRMLVGYIHKPRGTGSRMHTHKNEQFNYVVQGTLTGTVNGKRVIASAGTLIYIPADAPHTLMATPEEDVIFIAIKDLSQGIIGKAVDGTMEGPAYLEGYEPKQRSITRRRAA